MGTADDPLKDALGEYGNFIEELTVSCREENYFCTRSAKGPRADTPRTVSVPRLANRSRCQEFFVHLPEEDRVPCKT